MANASPVDRRGFLRGMAAMGGAVALGRAAEPATARPKDHGRSSILDAPAAQCPVDTIVVVMMENRSFDHHLGWLAGDEAYVEAGRRRYGHRFTVDGDQAITYVTPDGLGVDTYHLPSSGGPNPWRGCGGHPDPGHGWDSGRIQRDHGFLAEGSGNDEFAIGYFAGDDLPFSNLVARNFTVFDRYFASVMTGTYPNRYYLHAAQGDGTINGRLPGPDQLGFDFATIWDKLIAAGVPCRYYGTDLPVTGFWGTRLLPITTSVAQFFLDAAAGTLPNVVFVDPGFLSGMRTDDHPHGDTRTGQAFMASIAGALMRGPQWERSALIVTYDEWGGFFDHVPPPVLPDDRASVDDLQNWGQTGFRLPVYLASPYARPGYVDHRTYDHTSVLRLIQWRFLGAPAEGPTGSGWWLTSRDRAANNIGASLAPERVNDFVLQLGDVPVVLSAPCQGQAFQDVPVLVDAEDQIDPPLRDAGVDLDPITGQLRDVLVIPPDHQLGEAAEPFAAMGFSVEPQLTLADLLSEA